MGSSSLRLALGTSHVGSLLLWVASQFNLAGCQISFAEYLMDPLNPFVYSTKVYSVASQDILSIPGIPVATGLYNIILTIGYTNETQLSFTCNSLLLLSSFITILSIRIYIISNLITYLYKKSSIVAMHHLLLLGGLASIAWSGHLYHISLPVSIILSISPISLITMSPISIIFIGNHLILYSSINLDLSSTSGSLSILMVVYHHLGVGVSSVLSTSIYLSIQSNVSINIKYSVQVVHLDLSKSLFTLGPVSFIVAISIVYSPSPYVYLSISYQSILAICVHHIWISAISLLGSASHVSIYYIKSLSAQIVIYHRDIIVGHLVWICIFIGCHGFGIYVHNDTLYALGYASYTISDSTIGLMPLFALFSLSPVSISTISTLSNKVYSTHPELGTSDFLVSHINIFNIHVSILICLKGLLYSRSSRLVVDKSFLGFGYPCDGPGRGGTCQISPWDHIYLSAFWFYNSSSIIIFSISWSTSSYLWGNLSKEVVHLSNGDFTTSVCINSWLRDYLWTQSSQAIQSYGSQLGGYGYLFIGSHFLWSLSLMYLFSGRGYWQELIESVLWSHNKLNVSPNVSPRALSITHGRLVGAVHYIISGISVTWSYLLSRISVLTM